MIFNKEWVSISVFYNADSWQKLVRGAIGPLLTDAKATGLITGYVAYIGSTRGDFIQLKLHVNGNAASRVADAVQTTLGRFIRANPSPAPLADLPSTGLFLNFPNNSVHYNLYHYPENYPEGNYYVIFQPFLADVSGIIIELLEEDADFYTDNLVFFAVQLHFILLRSSGIGLSPASDLVHKNLIRSLPPHLAGDYERVLGPEFAEQHEEFTSYFVFLWHSLTDACRIDEPWMKRYVTACTDVSEHLRQYSASFQNTAEIDPPTDIRYHTLLELLMREMNKQLNIELEAHIFYLLEQAYQTIAQAAHQQP